VRVVQVVHQTLMVQTHLLALLLPLPEAVKAAIIAQLRAAMAVQVGVAVVKLAPAMPEELAYQGKVLVVEREGITRGAVVVGGVAVHRLLDHRVEAAALWLEETAVRV
jgi:hypothetical protein